MIFPVKNNQIKISQMQIILQKQIRQNKITKINNSTNLRADVNNKDKNIIRIVKITIKMGKRLNQMVKISNKMAKIIN
jgi:hypothetical protein